MALRSTMAQIIARMRVMIQDPAGASQFFADEDIQTTLDESVDFIRYEQLQIAPSIVNTASTGNNPQTIFADYYSKFQWWETDVVLQGSLNGAAWAVLTPLASDYVNGHWQFELTPFVNGTVPGQLPPVTATGKVYDLNYAAADLLEFWAMSFSEEFDFSSDGQSFHRSQLSTQKRAASEYFRKRAKPKVAKLTRGDILAPLSSRGMRLLDEGDSIKGA